MDGSQPVAAATRTTCPYCGVGCGVLARPANGADFRDGTLIAGDPAHPANGGRLCSKGTALGETVGLEGRLLHPEVRGRRASWAAALDAVAEGFRRARAERGPEGVALYVSGQLLTEDYYAANKFAKGFLGTANIDSNSRLCMASAVAGHRRAFGEDIVPGIYEDLEQADLVVLVGSNLAWCHPVVFQRLVAAKAARPGMRVVVIDPRRTATCEGADLHLPLRPGSDVALFNALLLHLHDSGRADPAWVAANTTGLDAALAAARADAAGAAPTGLDPADLATFLDWFAATPRTVTLWSQGTNQSSAGADKVNAIINCHLLTGRIGRPGMGPFSITGQPNAMGGREVGALANMLAGHLEWDRPDEAALLRGYWGAPNLATTPGMKAVEMFRALAAGKLGALWVMATNPAVSLPEAEGVREALARAPFLVVSDCTRESDTADLAHVRLPALAWGEKSGTVTNSERVISRQRGFLPWPGDARPDWWIVAQVARRLGWGEAFAWTGPADLFREHAALTGLGRAAGPHGGGAAHRLFDISGLAALSDAGYDAMPPTRWPCPAGTGGGLAGDPLAGTVAEVAPAARAVPAGPVLPAATGTSLDGVVAVSVLAAPAASATAPRAVPLAVPLATTPGGRRAPTPRSAAAAAPTAPFGAPAAPGGGRLLAQGPARFVPTPFRAPRNATSAEYPLALLTGRVRDQWHTMTRTGLAPRLMAHIPEPFLAIHPEGAAAIPGGLAEGSLARLASRFGEGVLRVRLDPGQGRGSVFVPMHWTDRFAPRGRVNPAVNAEVDPVSGQPELKHTPVRVEPWRARWHGFLLARTRLGTDLADWTAALPVAAPPSADCVWRHELAGEDAPEAAFERLRAPLAVPGSCWLTLEDPAGGLFRAVLLREARLEAVLFLGTEPALPPREWLAGLFAAAAIDGPTRAALLAGRLADGPPPSPLVCVCNGVSVAAIEAACAKGARSVDAVGAATRAGTSCGSCRPEISRMLAAMAVPA
ncbi:molybdopterin-dependent oxidoreductase [Roseomonas sp. NAR14]|uniref:Molybdopterin-dependent oxidoreductase n=1 Tax=Roseomonas acroporae TaxID=2937791 RepID=A0A9X1Y304_9PROT|nr:nitrate reductase [Roseomonas acroporae]MCK8782994.1 molybdopterin-dependent oxidoreductase [Roseomonas acroporae]